LVDVEGALRAYARMMNRLDVAELEPHLAEDFHYESQWVFDEISSKQEYLDYIRPKLATIRSKGATVWAEMGSLTRDFPGPCVVLAQRARDNLVAVVLATVANGQVSRLAMCLAPSPWSAERSGEYPGHPDQSADR
jgi:hypothetical protein